MRFVKKVQCLYDTTQMEVSYEETTKYAAHTVRSIPPAV